MINIGNIEGITIPDNIEEITIDKNLNKREIFDMIAMQNKSQLVMIVKLYNAAEMAKLSKKRFPFPLRLYFNKTEKYFIIGSESPDFPNKRLDYSEKDKKNFASFFLSCKLADEDNWFSLELPDIDHSIFRFGNGNVYKYGYENGESKK